MNSMIKSLLVLIFRALYILADNQRHLANRFGDSISYEALKILENNLLEAQTAVENYDTERWD